MVDLKVTGLGSTIRGLDVLAQTSYKRAASDALSDIAFIIAREEMPKEVKKAFDGYRPLTESAFLSQRASFKKDPIEARVFIKEAQNQDKYLAPNILGTARRAGDYGALNRGGILLPVNARLNQQGNFPSAKRYLGRSGTKRGAGTGARSEFVGIPKGRPNNADKYFGIWRRTGRGGRGGLTLLAAFRDVAQYEKDKLDFFGVSDRTFTTGFNKSFDKKISIEFKQLPSGWSS